MTNKAGDASFQATQFFTWQVMVCESMLPILPSFVLDIDIESQLLIIMSS